MVHIPTPSEIIHEASKTREFTELLRDCVVELQLGTLRRVDVPTTSEIANTMAVMRALRERGWTVKLAYDSETCSDFIYLSFPKEC
jgi:hypothetical protein